MYKKNWPLIDVLLDYNGVIDQLAEYGWRYEGVEDSTAHHFTNDTIFRQAHAYIDFLNGALRMKNYLWGLLPGALEGTAHFETKDIDWPLFAADCVEIATRYNTGWYAHMVKFNLPPGYRASLHHPVTSFIVYDSRCIREAVCTRFGLRRCGSSHVASRVEKREVEGHVPLYHGNVELLWGNAQAYEGNHISLLEIPLRHFGSHFQNMLIGSPHQLDKHPTLCFLTTTGTGNTYSICWAPGGLVTMSKQPRSNREFYNRQQPYAWLTADELLLVISRVIHDAHHGDPSELRELPSFVGFSAYARGVLNDAIFDYEKTLRDYHEKTDDSGEDPSE